MKALSRRALRLMLIHDAGPGSRRRMRQLLQLSHSSCVCRRSRWSFKMEKISQKDTTANAGAPRFSCPCNATRSISPCMCASAIHKSPSSTLAQGMSFSSPPDEASAMEDAVVQPEDSMGDKQESSIATAKKGCLKRPLPAEVSASSTSIATTPTDSTSNTTAALEPLTQDGDRPQKKYYRQRAHCNPLSHNDSFDYPLRPDLIDWTKEHYTSLPAGTRPSVLDIGSGFGGLTMALGPLLPNEVVLGMEIRAKLTEYLRLRIVSSRKESGGQSHQNCSAIRTNSMKFLPNFFAKGSISMLFFCFPDPHFKRKNHSRRIVSTRLLSEYAYVLKEGGRLYCITDVLELHEWHVVQCEGHPMFRRLDDGNVQDDPCVTAMISETEEGKKVERNGGSKYYAVYERVSDDVAIATGSRTASNFFSSAS